MTVLTENGVKGQISRNLPAIDQHEEVVEHVADGELRIRLPFRREYMGRDQWQNSGEGVFSGPMAMGLADTAMYGCVHGTYGHEVVTVIQSFNITFLRPAKPADLIAQARIIRRGRRSLYLECYLRSDGCSAPIGHATSTYALRHLPKP
jgi:acyl-coenzyme A thioesterase PaaI-like protein